MNPKLCEATELNWTAADSPEARNGSFARSPFFSAGPLAGLRAAGGGGEIEFTLSVCRLAGDQGTISRMARGST